MQDLVKTFAACGRQLPKVRMCKVCFIAMSHLMGRCKLQHQVLVESIQTLASQLHSSAIFMPFPAVMLDATSCAISQPVRVSDRLKSHPHRYRRAWWQPYLSQIHAHLHMARVCLHTDNPHLPYVKSLAYIIQCIWQLSCSLSSHI